jgi:hypothetical protein
MKKTILIGIILIGQTALADVPNLQIARDALNIHRENQRYAEAEYRRAKDLEERSRRAALASSESHTKIGVTYEHEPRLAETGIRRIK